jgi:hypothetical protein
MMRVCRILLLCHILSIDLKLLLIEDVKNVVQVCTFEHGAHFILKESSFPYHSQGLQHVC